MGTDQRGKSNSIKDLLVKIARREHLEISEGDATPFSIYASAWLERKKAILARSTYVDYRSIWKKYVLPFFGDIPLCREGVNPKMGKKSMKIPGRLTIQVLACIIHL